MSPLFRSVTRSDIRENRARISAKIPSVPDRLFSKVAFAHHPGWFELMAFTIQFCDGARWSCAFAG